MTMTNESQRTTSIAERSADAFAEFFRAFDSKPFLNMQLRSLDSLSKVSCAVSEAAAEIGEKQLAVLKTFAVLPDGAGGERFSGRSGDLDLRQRSVLAATAQQMRDIHDIVRDCWSKLAEEIQSCTRDNLLALGANLQTAHQTMQQGIQKTAEAGRAAGEYDAEAMRHASENGAIVMRRAGDAAAEATRKAAGDAADTARKAADATSKQMKSSPAE